MYRIRSSYSLIPLAIILGLVLMNIFGASKIGATTPVEDVDILISSVDTSRFDSVIRETTRLLYGNSSDLDKWLNAPLPKVYIYDTLEKGWSDVGYISTCVERKFMVNSTWDGCHWEASVCDLAGTPTDQKHYYYLSYKSNYNTDVAYLSWFESYPYRTRNPSEADIFLVPYPHKSHCLCHRDFTMGSAKCNYGVKNFTEHVLKKLTFFTEKKSRHLFIAGADYKQCPILFRKSGKPDFMSISLGQAQYCKNRPLCGHFVTPYLNFRSQYQPQVVASKSEDWWTTRKRSYSIGLITSTPKHLTMRSELKANFSSVIPATIAGLPTAVYLTGASRKPPDNLSELYQNSILCPILPGDDAVQKRFFDVILAGCIPLVPVWTPSDEKQWPTFFQWSGRASIRQTYPFHQGTFYGDATAGINYLDLVVTFDGFCGLDCMAPAAEKAMKNVTELTRIRQNLQKYARLFSFGLGQNAFESVDAFSGMIVGMRHYVHMLQSES